MKLFMVGATGRTGKWILKAALERGHQVTALIRPRPGRLTQDGLGLRVVTGDLFELPNLAELVAGHDAIFSALSSVTVEAGTRQLIAAAHEVNVPRFLGLAGGGILQLDADRLRRERPGYPAIFLRSSAGHLDAWKALEASSLDWTLFCTPDLLDAPATGRAKSETDYMPAGGNSVAAGDVAQFFVETLENGRFSKKRVGVTT